MLIILSSKCRREEAFSLFFSIAYISESNKHVILKEVVDLNAREKQYV